jgi:hypothetical protein
VGTECHLRRFVERAKRFLAFQRGFEWEMKDVAKRKSALELRFHENFHGKLKGKYNSMSFHLVIV